MAKISSVERVVLYVVFSGTTHFSLMPYCTSVSLLNFNDTIVPKFYSTVMLFKLINMYVGNNTILFSVI